MTRHGRLASAALLAIGLIDGSAARAAELRPFVTVHRAVIRLSDLFSGLQPGQDCPLGTGPSPGSQIVIGGPQLEAIANEFGVEWAASTGWQSVTITRPGESFGRDRAVEALRAVLAPLGLPPDSHLSLSGWSDLSIDPGSHVAAVSPVFDAGSGRFAADLAVSVGGHDTQTVHVEGIAIAMATVMVATHPIMTGEILCAGDLQAVERPRDQLAGTPIATPDAAIGLMAMRAIAQDEPVRAEFLRSPPLVTKGTIVMLRLEGNGLALSAEGMAIDTGALNDRVRVLNPVSQAMLVGTVLGRGEVAIDPDSTPMIVSNPASLGLPADAFRRAMSRRSFAGGMMSSGGVP